VKMETWWDGMEVTNELNLRLHCSCTNDNRLCDFKMNSKWFGRLYYNIQLQEFCTKWHFWLLAANSETVWLYLVSGSHASIVSILTRLQAGWSTVWILAGAKITWPPFQLTLYALSLVVKRLGFEVATHHHWVLRLRVSVTITQPFCIPSCHAQGQILPGKLRA
jgi:hypothetical protein